jgi:hypothetical protein
VYQVESHVHELLRERVIVPVLVLAGLDDTHELTIDAMHHVDAVSLFVSHGGIFNISVVVLWSPTCQCDEPANRRQHCWYHHHRKSVFKKSVSFSRARAYIEKIHP